ncbi:hypothetical protein [Mucilaginibacter rubeus]|uniref:Uncharacterized protein n=1 Tax=Mucilaginibacter rubeus TaxID=2027860 RepID=A0A5C1I124_9SPHI|nr:hypothetical protein [Mucilaginibacter rubeus]QEM10891.1 hypothetical protein DEO27_012950 [Mucilaginibacter rubeus]
MDLHHGEIVEKVVRRKGCSISEIARFTNVNRRSVYYWFNQKYLKPKIIYKIGLCLKHDFSVEFPHLFTEGEFDNIKNQGYTHTPDYHADEMEDSYWRDKYIELLEKYNKSLLENSKKKFNQR